MQKTLLNHGLIWFGAALSIAEILTGMAFAPLGLSRGLGAILLGHLIGCFLLFLAGIIGGRQKRSAMESVRSSFGYQGARLFALLNVIQLLGWTAVMIYDGALAASSALPASATVWALLIGALITVWILIGIRDLGKLNVVTMTVLFILTLVLSVIVFRGAASAASPEGMSYGLALELSIAMPISWLPVISDYTREAENPVASSLVSSLVYGLVSCWMYAIGLGAALFTGESDIALVMVKAGLGGVGLLIIVFSTVTTTFLDALSAGISAESIHPRWRARTVGLLATALGTLAAVFFPMDDIAAFLYWIGSVFVPMIAVMISDTFFLHEDHSESPCTWKNLLIWLAGFLFYRYMLTIDTFVGNTIPVFIAVILLSTLLGKIWPSAAAGKAAQKKVPKRS